MNRQERSKVNGLPALVFWIAVWYLAAMAMDNPLLLPTPVQVLRCLGRLSVTAAFWQSVAVSIGRILLGVFCAVILGCILAVVTTSCRLLEVLIAPAMTAMQAQVRKSLLMQTPASPATSETDIHFPYTVSTIQVSIIE